MSLQLFNYYSKQLEKFTSLTPGRVGMYVCGPTVYGDPHLGHARCAVVFDILFRYLQYSQYTVRYVRNITDVGHLEDEVEEQGEDKLVKQSKLENKEPMELAQYYTNSYHLALSFLNVLPPSIEPLATGHIPEQLECISRLVDTGAAYVMNGSVYFNLENFLSAHKEIYGSLSGVSVENMKSRTQDIAFQQEKKCALDFALWKQAEPSHIMKWRSPWAENGFPGWHTECAVMSEKYLGIPFDIHGGGIDLQFPHHEAEIAVSYSQHGKVPAKYWIYNNLITIEHQKMSKSLGNFITINDCFSGTHSKLSKGYSPGALRFFLLRSHYRNVLDFTDEALQGAERGLQKLQHLLRNIEQTVILRYFPLHGSSTKGNSEVDSESIKNKLSQCNFFNESSKVLIEAAQRVSGQARDYLQELETHMNNDLDTPASIATLFALAKQIEQQRENDEEDEELLLVFYVFCSLVLGLCTERENVNKYKMLIEACIELRKKAREEKNFKFADYLRDILLQANIVIKDRKDGSSFWEF